jgi:putative DNA-binding protein
MAEAPDALLLRFAAGLLEPGLDPTELFRGEPALAAARFALYRGNLTACWEKALGNAYPVLKQLVGEDFFRALAREYGRQRPSASGDLNQFGAGLADFLEDFEPTRPYPSFPDLARLEWLVHRAYYAADAPPLAPAELSPQALEGAAIRLRPGHALLASDWAVVALWQAHQQPPATFPGELNLPCRALVHRPDWRVQVREVGPGEWAALARLQAGAWLVAALEAGLDADPDFDPGAALQAWLAEQLLTHHEKETP